MAWEGEKAYQYANDESLPSFAHGESSDA